MGKIIRESQLQGRVVPVTMTFSLPGNSLLKRKVPEALEILWKEATLRGGQPNTKNTAHTLVAKA